MGGCQDYDPFLGTLSIRCRIKNRDPKRDQYFANHPCESWVLSFWALDLGLNTLLAAFEQKSVGR